jgi:hypothetical protein
MFFMFLCIYVCLWTGLYLGCDFFRKYTDTQIRIGRCAKVFPSPYLFCIIVISLWNNADRHKKWPFFYLREQINLSAAQIKVCLDAKHWDLLGTHSVDASLYFSPNCRQVVHVESQYDYSPLSASSLSPTEIATTAAAMPAAADFRRHASSPTPQGSTVLVWCFIWVLRGCGIRHQFWLYRDGIWCWFHVRGCIWFRFCWFWGIWIRQYILWIFC